MGRTCKFKQIRPISRISSPVRVYHDSYKIVDSGASAHLCTTPQGLSLVEPCHAVVHTAAADVDLVIS